MTKKVVNVNKFIESIPFQIKGLQSEDAISISSRRKQTRGTNSTKQLNDESQAYSLALTLSNFHPGVNFTNILPAAFTGAETQKHKKTVRSSSFLCFQDLCL